MLLRLPNGEYVPAQSLMWGVTDDGKVWGRVPGGEFDDVDLEGDAAAAMLRWLDAHSTDITKPDKPKKPTNKRLW
jgi:hypothetical protein